MTEQLVIPITFEEMSEEIKHDILKLSQIIQPVEKAEEQLNIVLKNTRHTGYIIYLLGRSGSGKSTFVSSLKWRSHIVKRSVINIDASEALPIGGLSELFNRISSMATDAVKEKDKGPTIVIIDYLESIADFNEDEIKGFFRNVNGLLRKSPILIVWLLTSEEEATQMIELANIISTTMFYPDNEKIIFTGPKEATFIDIAKRTISFLNSGKEPSEFGLTSNQFEEIKRKFDSLPVIQKTIRQYMQMIKKEWEITNEYIERLKITIPKPIEVWFIFSYPNAESVISQFSRKGQTVDESWTAFHDKFYEYIPGSQRSAIWNATRLQLALFGYIKTRVMYLPTNAFIAAIYANTDDAKILSTIESYKPPLFWKQQAKARAFLSTTPMAKQIMGEKFQVGFRKGGPAAAAIAKATPIFTELNRLLTKGGVSDTVYNKAIAKCLRELTSYTIEAQRVHPWLEKITPDVLVELPEKTISIEFHHTDDDTPYKIADYVLLKLNTYMNQIEEKM
jgi:hypothetical protein